MYFSFTFVLLFPAINPFWQSWIFALTSFSLNKTPSIEHKHVWRSSRIYRKNGYLFFVLYPPRLRPRPRTRPERIHKAQKWVYEPYVVYYSVWIYLWDVGCYLLRILYNHNSLAAGMGALEGVIGRSYIIISPWRTFKSRIWGFLSSRKDLLCDLVQLACEGPVRPFRSGLSQLGKVQILQQLVALQSKSNEEMNSKFPLKNNFLLELFGPFGTDRYRWLIYCSASREMKTISIYEFLHKLQAFVQLVNAFIVEKRNVSLLCVFYCFINLYCSFNWIGNWKLKLYNNNNNIMCIEWASKLGNMWCM